jgi:hypothetical protein
MYHAHGKMEIKIFSNKLQAFGSSTTKFAFKNLNAEICELEKFCANVRGVDGELKAFFYCFEGGFWLSKVNWITKERTLIRISIIFFFYIFAVINL